MDQKKYETVLSTSIEEIKKLIEIAQKNINIFKAKKELTSEEKKQYDTLLKYNQGLNIILVHKQQNSNLSFDSLTNETAKAVEIILQSGYNL